MLPPLRTLCPRVAGLRAERARPRAHPRPSRERSCREPADRPDEPEQDGQAPRWRLAQLLPVAVRPGYDGPVAPEPEVASKDVRGRGDSCFQGRPEVRIVR